MTEKVKEKEGVLKLKKRKNFHFHKWWCVKCGSGEWRKVC